jgi:hypothetical protein
MPLIFTESPADHIVHQNTVVQHPLRFTPGLSLKNILSSTMDEPLAAMNMTLFVNLGCTAIGVTRWHPLGSDFVITRFMRALSQTYQGLPISDPLPVYRHLGDFLPPANGEQLVGVDTTAVNSYCSPRVKRPQDPSNVAATQFDFRLSASQVEQIRKGILIQQQNDPRELRISRQDSLVALVAVCMNQADPDTQPPISIIDTVLDLRGTAGIPTDLAGNGFTFAPTETIVPKDADDLHTFASTVRQSLVRAREPQFLAALVALQREKAVKGSKNGEFLDLTSPPGHMMVNSTLK